MSRQYKRANKVGASARAGAIMANPREYILLCTASYSVRRLCCEVLRIYEMPQLLCGIVAKQSISALC